MTHLVTLPPSYADEAWKNALDVFLPEFMQFFYQEIAAQIAWEAKCEYFMPMGQTYSHCSNA